MTDPLVLDALRPWDGSWFHPVPSSMRLVTVEQHTALQILRGREGLTVADARMLQAIATNEGELSDLARFRLDRLARVHDERIAA